LSYIIVLKVNSGKYWCLTHYYRIKSNTGKFDLNDLRR